MYTFPESILRKTAWPMTPPAPYSAFHIILTVLGTGLAVLLARILSKKGLRESISLSHNSTQTMNAPESYLRRILFSCGLILALMELYKQAFLYFIEFDGHYDWWYFPFQLCISAFSFRLIPYFTTLFQTLIHPLDKVRRGVPGALCHRVAFSPDRREINIRAIVFKRKRQIYFCRERRIALGNSGADPPVTGNCGLLISIIIS